MRKQTGHLYQKWGWWYLRYRENVMESGQLVRRQIAKRIAPVDALDARCKRAPKKIQDLAERELRPLNQGAYTPEATETLGEFVERVYFPNLESRLRASTMKGYKARWESQLKARCGHFRLREFRTCDGQKVLAEIARQDGTLLRSTLRHLRSLLSGVFRHAIQQGYMQGPNPIREVGTPGAPEGQETYAYSLEEVSQMLLYLPQPAKGLVAVAAFSGLRRSELAGLEWQDYRGGEIFVSRSVWEGHVSEPKTRKSKAPVPVVRPLAQILDAWRAQSGNPTAGVMFPSGKGTPLNLNNVLHREILPALNRCKTCGKAKDDHVPEAHVFERDAARPMWHGWHAFRRGLATNLHSLGVQDKIIQAILRHSNVAVTQACYIKTVDADSAAAMKLLEAVLCTVCAPETATDQPQRLN